MELPELDWRVQTRAVEQIKTPPRMLQDLIFRERNPNEADTVEVDVIKGGKKLAPFVTDLEGGQIVKGTTREARVVKTPRIRLKEPMPAKKLLGERGIGQTYYAGGVTDVTTAMRRKVALENRELKNRISTRTEWMCAQALAGLLTVDQENIQFQVDYLIPSEHKITLSGTDLWSDSAAKPRKQVKTWAQMIIDALGYGPDLMICGTDAAAALDDRIGDDKWFDARALSAGQFNWKATSNYMGNLGGVDVYSYGSSYEDASGADRNLIPPDKIYLIATQARFSIEFGIILDLEAEASVVGEIFAKSWVDKDPSAFWNLQESRPLPVPWEPEAIIEVQVL